jgi:pimeloyl-ACP methyl ester carboxylesterase
MAVPPLTDDAIQLGDGRRLAYSEWGEPRGHCVFLFHGTPNSRLFCPDEAVTASSNVRLVTVDRPGIGGSDVLPRRTLGDWPGDVVQLADALGVEKFGVVGWSAGGVYAAACAALIPARLTGVGIACTRHLSESNVAENPSALEELDAADREMFDLAQRDPDAAARAPAEQEREWVESIWNRPESGVDRYKTPAGDQWFFQDEKRLRPFFEATRESVRQGPEAVAWELIDAWLPWGFRVADIAVGVDVWHGAQDPLVDRRHVDFTVQLLPNARLTVWEDSGHFGLARHWGEILEAVGA